ncbi:MAG: hypothetical protein ABI045_06500 [Flavobacteriales bacterium]
MATQNQVDHGNTYSLPEARVDHFMMKYIIDYTDVKSDKKIIKAGLNGNVYRPEPW